MNYTQLAGQYIGQAYNDDLIERRKQAQPLIHVLDAQTDEILETLGRETPFWDDLHRRLLKNYEETFDFKTIPEGKASEYLRERNRLIIPTEDGFFREFIIDEHVQNRDSLEVYATASYLELAKDRPIEPATYSGQTVNTMTDVVLNATGWIRGITEYAGSRTIEFEGWETPFSALKKVASTFDLELRFRIETLGSRVIGRYVDLIERQGEWRGREITSGKDLVNAKRTENTTEVVTALVGLGPEKEDGTRITVEITDDDARQAWGRNGRHLWGIHEIESENQDMTQAEVEQYTTTELNKRIAAAVNYEVDGVDLEQMLNRSHEQIRLGDDVRIKATEYNPPIYLDARIIGIETPINDRSQKKYTLGEFIEYSEEDINALKNYLKKLIGLKVTEGQVRNITYDKDTIDNKDNQIRNDITNGEIILPGEAVEYQDNVPPAPTNFQAEGLFKVITLRWDYDPSAYISDYEVYASPTSEFTPSEVNLIYKGDAGGCVHEANVNETWYYKLRAVNTKGTGSAYVTNSASTLKIDADTEISPLTITNQLIAENAAIDFAKIANVQIVNAMIESISWSKAVGGTATLGGTDNGYGRLLVLDANGETIADLDAESGGFNELFVGQLESPSIINANYADYSIYVDPVNGDDNANGGTSWSDAFETIRGALDTIPKYNNGVVTILTANGGVGYTYNEFIRIQGFEGGGEIVLDFRTPLVNNLTGRINITNCTNAVRVKNVIVQHDANTNSVIGQWGGRAYLENVVVYGNGTAGDGFYCHGGNMELRNCEVYDLTGEQNCIVAAMNASIYVVDCKGLGDTGLRGHSGGWFSGFGTQPMGSTYQNRLTSGSFTHATFTEDAGSATPPPPPETTSQWKASSASNWSSSGYWSESYPKQGNWGYGRRTGYWFFGSTPSTAVTGKTISRIRVTIKRKSSGGYSDSVPIRLHWHTYTGKPSGAPSDVNLSTEYKDVSLAWGKEATVTLPSSFHSYFESGTAKGIGIYYPSDSGSYYAAMEASATLEITYQ